MRRFFSIIQNQKTLFKSKWALVPILAAYGMAFFDGPYDVLLSSCQRGVKTSLAQQVPFVGAGSSGVPVFKSVSCAAPLGSQETKLQKTAQVGHQEVGDQDVGHQEKLLVVQTGDTFTKLLERIGLSSEEGYGVTTALKSVINPRKLTVGQKIRVRYIGNNGISCLEQLSFSPEMGVEIVVTSSGGDGVFQAKRITYPLHTRQVAVEGTIRCSLYQDALDQGVDPKILHKIIRVLSHRFDLQRDVKPGDKFKFLYRVMWDKNTQKSLPETFLFVAMQIGGKNHTFYHFKPPGANTYQIFDANGRSLRQAFLCTPVDGARLSSSFGPRKHPVWGYSKFHQGSDFAAPSGTRVLAAGNGVVQKASFYGSYGNYIRIAHNSEYQTAYAHLRGFAPHIKPGTKVVQGQVIGYVGTTGRSTGPHLHFELIKCGKRIDPKNIQKMPKAALQGADLKAFQQYTQKMTRAYLVQISSQKGNL